MRKICLLVILSAFIFAVKSQPVKKAPVKKRAAATDVLTFPASSCKSISGNPRITICVDGVGGELLTREKLVSVKTLTQVLFKRLEKRNSRTVLEEPVETPILEEEVSDSESLEIDPCEEDYYAPGCPGAVDE